MLKRLEEQIALKEKQDKDQKENAVSTEAIAQNGEKLSVPEKTPPKINIEAKKSFDEKDGDSQDASFSIEEGSNSLQPSPKETSVLHNEQKMNGHTPGSTKSQDFQVVEESKNNE